MFIAFLYVFRAIMCPSSGKNTVPMRHLVFVTVKQVDSLKLQWSVSKWCYLQITDKISLKFLCKFYYYLSDFLSVCVCA